MRTRSPSAGLGDQNDRKHPVLLTSISGRNIRKISCGNSHSMLLSDRDVIQLFDLVPVGTPVLLRD